MRAAAQPPRPDVRHCVALFVDLHDFTAFTGETDPEEVHDYLLRYRTRVAELVREGGGEITNYIGARVMAVFGAIVAHDNEAQRAADVALAWREEIPGLASSSGRWFQPHIGVASGGLFVDRSSGVPVVSGEPVSLAARIMEQAGPGEILVSGWVRHALSDSVHADPVSDVAVRAAARPVQLWRLRGWADRAETARALVGRALELRQIEGVLDACQSARAGHVLLVRGDAGIGKSRLVQELLQRARTRGYACHRALALDFGSGMAGGVVPVLARALLGLSGGPVSEPLGAATQRWIEAGLVGRDLAPFVYELLEVPVPAHPSEDAGQALDREARARGHQAVLDSLIRARCESAPLLLVAEDVHWAERATLDMLARAAAAARDLPLVLALTSRSEPDPIDAAWRAACGRLPAAHARPGSAHGGRGARACRQLRMRGPGPGCLVRAARGRQPAVPGSAPAQCDFRKPYLAQLDPEHRPGAPGPARPGRPASAASRLDPRPALQRGSGAGPDCASLLVRGDGREGAGAPGGPGLHLQPRPDPRSRVCLAAALAQAGAAPACCGLVCRTGSGTARSAPGCSRQPECSRGVPARRASRGRSPPVRARIAPGRPRPRVDARAVGAAGAELPARRGAA